MMGPEPFARALDEAAGDSRRRSSDPAQMGRPGDAGRHPAGPAWYGGKMLECGAERTVPKEPDTSSLRVRDDHIVCEPPNPIRRSTPLAVANSPCTRMRARSTNTEPGGLSTPAPAPSRR